MKNYIDIIFMKEAVFIYIILTVSTIAYTLGTIYSAIFYRLGGTGGPWYKRSWIRDWICPLVVFAVMQWTKPALQCPNFAFKWPLEPIWALYLCYPLMILALSTYWKWKWFNAMFGKDTNDCYWFNWFFHGLGVGLAMLPYGYFTHTMDLVMLRAYALAFGMMFWSLLIDKVEWEEGGRGAAIILSLPIL